VLRAETRSIIPSLRLQTDFGCPKSTGLVAVVAGVTIVAAVAVLAVAAVAAISGTSTVKGGAIIVAAGAWLAGTVWLFRTTVVFCSVLDSSCLANSFIVSMADCTLSHSLYRHNHRAILEESQCFDKRKGLASDQEATHASTIQRFVAV
jgi:hypothetical protein